jgi:hypothetical protein
MDIEQIRRMVIMALFSDDVLVEKLVLKGGNALRLVYGIGSFSVQTFHNLIIWLKNGKF